MGSNQSLHTISQFFSYHIFPPLLHLFFPSFFLSSSDFFYPFSPAFLPLSFLFLFLFFLFLPLVSFLSSHFCCFFSSLSSLYFILLISSSFSPPLSFSLFFFFPFSHLNFFLVSLLCQGGCYEHKGNNNRTLLVPNISPTSLH